MARKYKKITPQAHVDKIFRNHLAKFVYSIYNIWLVAYIPNKYTYNPRSHMRRGVRRPLYEKISERKYARVIRQKLLKFYKETPSGCWEWNGPRNGAGYGRVACFGKSYGAHRVSAWVFKDRKILDNSKRFVCHKCDNPSCINPRHLFIGFAQANMRDCLRKGRHRNNSIRQGRIV